MARGLENNLIYDVGLHKGEDSEFYLKKGFRVVAIEAFRLSHGSQRSGSVRTWTIVSSSS